MTEACLLQERGSFTTFFAWNFSSPLSNLAVLSSGQSSLDITCYLYLPVLRGLFHAPYPSTLPSGIDLFPCRERSAAVEERGSRSPVSRRV